MAGLGDFEDAVRSSHAPWPSRVRAPLAAWPSGLGKGLQIPVPGFDSRRRLQSDRARANEGARGDWHHHVIPATNSRPSFSPPPLERAHLMTLTDDVTHAALAPLEALWAGIPDGDEDDPSVELAHA